VVLVQRMSHLKILFLSFEYVHCSSSFTHSLNYFFLTRHVHSSQHFLQLTLKLIVLSFILFYLDFLLVNQESQVLALVLQLPHRRLPL
jgi:hypothetical protein